MTSKTPHDQYEKRLVAFLDLLGFKELVSRFPEEPKLFDWTLSILKATKSQEKMVYGFPEDLNVQMEFTAFSDSVVLSSRIPEDPINMALFQVAFTCSLFLRAGLFARGAIVENYLYHKENIIIGQGLIEAYQQEKIAIYPRVIVSKNIVDKFNEEIKVPELTEKINKWSSTLIRKDIDGCYFIDTLYSIPHVIFKDEFIPFIESTKKIIKMEIENNENNETVLQKSEWFKHYFNEIINEHPEYNVKLIR